MRKPIPQIAACLLSLAVFLPASAQELPGGVSEEPEIRRYTVEVIIFRYAQEVSTGSEVFIADEPELDDGFGDNLQGDRPIVRKPRPQTLPDTGRVLLNRSNYQLNDVLRHLRRLDIYEPVMHFGWTQATWPEEQTEAIPLSRFGRPPEGLDGSLTLYLSRYLHLVVDLRLADTRTVGELRDVVNAQPSVYYQIQENRILKNGELRYFDHPKFGVLAMVTRVEEEEEDPETGELLGYGPE